MTKGNRILAAGFVSVCMCTSVWAQQIGDRAGTGFFGRSMGTPAMSLSDAHAFPFGSSFAWMAPSNNFLPDWRPTGWDSSGVNLSAGWGQPVRTASMSGYSKDSSKESAVEVRRSNLFDYVHGEVGGFFGTSTGGRNSLTSEGGYIFTEVGNENVHIGVGAFYEHSNFDYRRGR